MVDITGHHQVIAEVSFTAALTTLHEKAIYLHEARQFQVEKLDYEGRKAYVRRVDSDYFTDAIDYTQVKELEEFEAADVNGARAAHGDVRVNTQVVGFKKLKFYSMENIGAGNLSMPEQELHTTAFWLHLPESFLARFPDMTPTERQSGLTGLVAADANGSGAAVDVRSPRFGRRDYRGHLLGDIARGNYGKL